MTGVNQEMKIHKLRSTSPNDVSNKPISGIAMSSRNNGMIVSWSGNTLHLWGYPQMLLISKIECCEGIELVAIEKKIAVLLKNGVLQVFDLSLKEEKTHSSLTRYQTESCQASVVAFSGPQVVLFGYRKSLIQLYNFESELTVAHDVSGGSSVCMLTRDHTHRTLLGSVEGQVHLLTQSALLDSISISDNIITSCSLASSGSVAVCVSGGVLFVINIKKDVFVKSSKKSINTRHTFSRVSCSSDGNLLLVVSERTLQVIRVSNLRRNFTVEAKFSDPESSVSDSLFVPHLIHVQHHLLKDPDYRSSVVYSAGSRIQALEVCDPNHMLWSKAVLISTLMLIFIAALFAIITP